MNNWQIKKLGDESILKMTSGGTPSRSNPGFYNGDILWLKSGELNDSENIVDSEEKITGEAIKNSSAKIFPVGTVLFAMYGATAGKIGILGVEATTNQAVAGMIPNEDVLYNRYLYYFLTHERTEIISRAWGGAQPNLSQTILKGIEIPLPPLEEQKNIVKMLDEKMGKITEAKHLRAEVLADTEKILPQTLYEIFEEGKKNGWREENLCDICEIARGGSPRPINEYITDAEDGINWIKISDASNSTKYIYETKQKIKKEGLHKTRLVYPGDFILTNSMSFGRPYIMKTTGAIHDGWLLLRPDKTITEEYLYYFLSSDDIYRQFTRLAGGAVVQNLNSSLVRNVKILIPPLPKQQKIVAQLDALSEKVLTLRDLQTAQLADLKSLERSYLREAFAYSK